MAEIDWSKGQITSPNGANAPTTDWSKGDIAPPEKPSGLIRRAADQGIKLAQGVVGLPESFVGVADLVTGGRAGKLAESAGVRFKDAKDIMGEYLSPEQKAADAEVGRAQGFLPTVGAAISNPSTILGGAMQSAPSLLAGGAVSRGAMALAPKLSPILAGALGEGAVAAGQNAEQVRQEDPNGTLTAQQSAILAGSGLLTGGISLASGKLANKLGIGDVQTMMATGRTGVVGDAAQAAAMNKGLLRRGAEGFANEGVGQELPQSYQEQVAQNLAQGKPWDQGAANAGAMGMLSGGLTGGVANIISGNPTPPPPVPTPEQLTADSNQANNELGAVADQYGDLTTQAQIGFDPAVRNVITPENVSGQPFPRNIVEVERQDGQGSTTIDRTAGPLSSAAADAVEGGLTSSMAAQVGPLIKSYPTQQEAQAALEARPDADRMQLGRHPRSADRFAILPKTADALNSMDAKAAATAANQTRTQQVEQEDGNAPAPAAPTALTVESAMATVDDAAHTAATSPTNDRPEPTDGQKAAGNYAKGHITLNGMRIAVENPVGSTRSGVDESGQPWQTQMQHHYGYVKGSTGNDGDNVDLFIKPQTPLNYSGPVFVIDQINPRTGAFDEHKGIVGATTVEEAQAIYQSNYAADWQGMGPVTEMPFTAFKSWVRDGEKTVPLSQDTQAQEAIQAELQAPAAQPLGVTPAGQQQNTQAAAAANQTAQTRAQQVQLEEGTTEAPARTIPLRTPQPDMNAAPQNKAQSARATAADAAQAEINQSVGKESKVRSPRKPGESNEAYMARRATESNQQKAQTATQQKSVPTKGSDTEGLRQALGDKSNGTEEAVAVADLPDATGAGPQEVSKQAAAFINHVARLFGKRVVFAKNMSADGMRASGNNIYLSTKSSVAHLRVLGHEMLHALKAQNPESYKNMLSAVSHLLTDKEFAEQHKDYFGTEMAEGYLTDKTRDFLAEEWMADLSGNRFAEEGFWKDVFTQVEATHGPQAAKGIIARLRMAIVNALNKLLKLVNGNQFAVDARMGEHLADIRKAVADGFAQYAVDVKAGRVADEGTTGVKFSKGTDATQEDDDSRATIEQADIPETVDAQATLESTLERAKSKVWNKGRDLKLVMQKAVQDAAAAAGVDVGAPSEASTKYLARVGTKDAVFALGQNPNAVGWYDLKTRQALSVMALVHPELAHDPDARLAFVWAMAVTSNGLKVGKNFEIAEKVYQTFKDTGKMPGNLGIGTAAGAINDSLELFNELKTKWGAENLRKFMLSDFTVSEITGIAKDLKPGGEHADVTVKGAAILGPKIGNGFFSNLYGNFDSLTMDRWLVRTWGRWTGTLISPMPKQTAKATERLETARSAILGNPAEATRLGALLGVEITADTSMADLSKAVQEASMEPATRTEMNRTAEGLELRKAGNGLAKYLDGQKEAPAGPTERKYIRKVFGEILSELRKTEQYKDLSMADLQAVLWYAEKRLYESAKQDTTQDEDVDGYSDEDAPDYANAAAAVARAAGVTDRRIQNALKKESESGRTTDARRADVQEGQDRPSEQGSVGGFTEGQKSEFITWQALKRLGSDRLNSGEPSWAYESRSAGDAGRVWRLKEAGVTYVAEWKLGTKAANVLRANGLKAVNLYELAPGDPNNAKQFSAAITASKEAGKFGAAVYVYPTQSSADEIGYADMRMFLTKDGKNGVAVKANGDIVSVFAAPKSGNSLSLMQLALAVGGRKLDAFDTVLPSLYSMHGFKAVSRIPWSNEPGVAPEGWDKGTFRKFNGGQPDVVFMAYDPHHGELYQAVDGKTYDDYDKAVAAQTRAVNKVAKDVPKSGPRFSNARQPFYSALAKEVGTMKMQVAPAFGWRDAIKGLVNKGLVKQDEIEWSGLNDWLEPQTGKVTRDQVQQYLDQNGVQVEEVTLADAGDVTTYVVQERTLRGWHTVETFDDEDEAYALKDSFDTGNYRVDTRVNPNETVGATKYDQYTLPGGENYREVLLTLPVKTKQNTLEARKTPYGYWEAWNKTTQESEQEGTEDEVNKYVAETMRSLADPIKTADYQSAHWDQKNVLAHLRVDDRTDADGARVLMVQELQSDWGQDKHAGKAVPDAPFVTNTTGWLNLALKRVIAMAAQGGYDKVAFVTGEQSADRYDLSKSIKIIDYSVTGDQNYHVEAFGHDGDIAIGIPHSLDAAGVEDYVGKELAKQIIDNATNKKQSITGGNLKVGGGGMKAFYDKIVPNATSALLKKLGGGKMETVSLTNQEGDFDSMDLDNATPEEVAQLENGGVVLNQPGFTITPAMQEKAAGGLPLFSKKRIAGDQGRSYTADQLKAFDRIGVRTVEPSLKERAQEMMKDLGKKMAQGIADQFAPVKALDGTAYGLLRLAKGASGAFEALLQGGKLKLSDNVYDIDGNARGGVVDRLLKPLQGEHHDFLRWVAAHRAEKLLGQGKENLFTPEDIKAFKTLADGKTGFDYTLQNGPRAGQVTRDRAEIYRDAQATFNGFNKNVLDMAEQSGLIDGSTRHLWESEFYVPFYRVADDDAGGVRGMNIKGAAVRQQAFKALKGGKNALNTDLLDNTLMNWAHLLDASAKNRAAKATIEAAEKMGIAMTGNQTTLAQLGASIHNKNGVVWFMDGGQKRYSLIDNQGDGPYIMTALTSLEYAGMRNPVMNAMGAFKHALTVGVTASPFFKVRNLIRDSVQVIGTGQISYNVGKNLKDGWKLTDPKSDAYFRLLAGGGTIHFGTMLEGSEAKRVQALVESGIDDATVLNNPAKVKAFYRKFVEPGVTAYNELGNRGEAVNRAALYDQLRKQGVNHADASLQARDLMDFSMQGSFTSVRFFTQVVPFMNARIQGMYKLGKSAKEDPTRFGTVLGVTALMSLSLLAAYSDDEDWKKRSESDRNNFWWFKVGGTAFRIPKPFEIGAIGTLAERSFELAFDKEMTDKRFLKQILDLLGDNLSMNPIPQLVKPIMDVYANKDSFSGMPIENMSQLRLKSEYRFNDRTSMLARGASTALNSVTGLANMESVSPVQIDHMLRGYFGWLGTMVVSSADVLARPATDQPTQATPDYLKVLTGNMASDLRDAPSRYVSQLYEQAKEIEKAHGTWRALQREGKLDEAKEFADDHKDALMNYRRVENAKKSESLFNNMLRMVERNTTMSADEKRERIRAIQVQKNRVAENVS